MTPEAHERRRIRMPVLAVTTVAWAVTLLADPLMSASGSGAGSAPGSGAGRGPALAALVARVAHVCGAHHAVVDAGLPASHASTEHAAGLLIGWALMLTAMMAPLLIPALRHVRARSLRSRRWRAVSLVTVAHAAVWTVGGIVLLAVASLLRSVTGQPNLAVLLGLDAALAWQLSPLKQYCLNRHCAHPPISSFGSAADRDALRFGGTHAVWCLGSCWALMLVSLLAPAWHVAVMLVVSVWMWVEPLDRPERPTWRVRLPLRFLRLADATVRSLPQRVAIRAGTSMGQAGLAGPGGLRAGVSRSGR
jgi:predicted metal-binding membrane protein